MLLTLLAIPLLGAVAVALAARLGGRAARAAALVASALSLVFSLALAAHVAASGPVASTYAWSRNFGTAFLLQADGLSAILALLTALLGFIAVVAANEEIRTKETAFYGWMLLLLAGIQLVFLANDVILFYFGYELMLIPAFFLIGMWDREARSPVAMRFFVFTFAGSIFILASFLYLYFAHGQQTGRYTFALESLIATGHMLPPAVRWWLFLGLLIGFMVKVPLIPLHQWLPDAYTQSPACVALVLSGLMSKTGAYGLLRFAYPLAPASPGLNYLVIFLAVVGILYGAVVAYGQTSFRRLVAYSSIAHLGFVVLGLTTGDEMGYRGAVLQMVNHGLATGALFLLAAMIYRRTQTLSFDYLGGLWSRMPMLGGYLLFFSLASLGLPGTGNFVGEIYIIASSFHFHWLLGFAAAFGVLLASAYSLKLYIRTMQGPEPADDSMIVARDANAEESWILGSLATLLVIIGIFPGIITGILPSAESVGGYARLDASGNVLVPSRQRPGQATLTIAPSPDFTLADPTAPADLPLSQPASKQP